MRRVSCVGLAVLACVASGCGQNRNYASGTRLPAAPMVASVPVNNPAQPVVISSDPVVATPVTRQGVRVFEEKVSGLPGQPDLIKRKSTEWYEGPDDGKSFGQSPGGTGVNNNPGYRLPPKAATTAPVNPNGQLPPEDPTKRPVGQSDRGTLLLEPVPVKQPEPNADEEKPMVGKIRVYQTGPNGERIPARSYDDKGNLIVEEEDKETTNPNAPTANNPVEPKRLPTLPVVNPPVPAKPVALPFTPVPVPTITPPPALPAVPTIPAPPPASSQPPVYTPQLPPVPPLQQGPTLPNVSKVKVASDVVHAEFRK